MRVKHLAQKHKMTKGMNAATSWVPSVFTQKDLNKARADGLVSDEDQVIFPSTERIPKPKDGFRVMFFRLSLAWSFPSCPRVPSWASFRLWCAALSAHTKFHPAYCLLHNSLRVVSGDRSPLSSLEISLSAPPQCLIIKETRTGWSLYFCPC
jgi:hypothetical protein